MGKLMRYLGVFVVLFGVLLLISYFFGLWVSNSCLVTAAIFMIGGTVAHVILNKRYLDE